MDVQRGDLNRLIMNYFVTEGYKEAAEKFQLESGTPIPMLSSDSLEKRMKITNAVHDGDISNAIYLVNSVYPDILDSNPQLYFHLQQQKLIELIRKRDIEGALDFAQTHLADRGMENPGFLEELERTMALLAFEDPESSSFCDLLNSSQRQKVASELNAAILEEEDCNSSTKMAELIKLLIWSQRELDKHKVTYDKMTDIVNGTITKSE